MEHFWDLLFQFMENGTKTLHVRLYFCSVHIFFLNDVILNTHHKQVFWCRFVFFVMNFDFAAGLSIGNRSVMPAGQNSSQLKREPAIVVLNLTYQPGVQL
jgi:hypothetical protein